jgi:hypothetical protein
MGSRRPPASAAVSTHSDFKRGINTLYNNPLAFKHFGYGGEEGDTGYLYKGFNELTWLPEPPLEASGPIPKDG